MGAVLGSCPHFGGKVLINGMEMNTRIALFSLFCHNIPDYANKATANRHIYTVRVSERTVCDPFLKHATVGYMVTWLRLVTT